MSKCTWAVFHYFYCPQPTWSLFIYSYSVTSSNHHNQPDYVTPALFLLQTHKTLNLKVSTPVLIKVTHVHVLLWAGVAVAVLRYVFDAADGESRQIVAEIFSCHTCRSTSLSLDTPPTPVSPTKTRRFSSSDSLCGLGVTSKYCCPVLFCLVFQFVCFVEWTAEGSLTWSTLNLG